MREDILKTSSARAVSVIGDRWTLMILIDAFLGVGHFDQWRERHGLSPAVLAQRLRHLVDCGILNKVKTNRGLSRSRYSLTDKGKDLFPWALAVWNWERKWIYQRRQQPLRLVHDTCQEATIPEVRCRKCRSIVHRSELVIIPRPDRDKIPEVRLPRTRLSKIGSVDESEDAELGKLFETFGDRWSFMTLAAAFFDIRRFDQLQSELKIASNILADRLHRMTEQGLLARSRYQMNPTRYEYLLTEKSLDFLPFLLAIAQWSEKWLAGSGGGNANDRIHGPCNSKMEVAVICRQCGQEMTIENSRFENC